MVATSIRNEDVLKLTHPFAETEVMTDSESEISLQNRVTIFYAPDACSIPRISSGAGLQCQPAHRLTSSSTPFKKLSGRPAPLQGIPTVVPGPKKSPNAPAGTSNCLELTTTLDNAGGPETDFWELARHSRPVSRR